MAAMLPKDGPMTRADAPCRPNAACLQEVREEYAEMPCLRLTLPQARRLFGLDHAQAMGILAELVRQGFLKRTSSGLYARADEI